MFDLVKEYDVNVLKLVLYMVSTDVQFKIYEVFTIEI